MKRKERVPGRNRAAAAGRTRGGGSRREFTLDAAAMRSVRMLVVGDAMLDRYWFGDVGRISPEAPVPVVKVERVEERPGGAGNVARNAAALGAQVELLSVIGRDEAGARLKTLVRQAGVHGNLLRDGGLATTVKLRVIGRQQQLLRVDFETEPSRDVLLEKFADYRRLLEASDVVILSDYGKGGLAHIVEMIRLARTLGKPVLVDPKGDDYSRYRGATAVTPNRSELREVVGRWSDEKDLAGRAQKLRRSLGLEALLLTRSEEGMTLFQQGAVHHEAAKAKEVYDVSGAGDTVIAVFGVMLGAGAGLREAMRIANQAAGIVVSKFGTAVARLDELVAALEPEPGRG